MISTLPGSEGLADFCSQEATTRTVTVELFSILEVIAVTGKYWHDWSQLKQLFAFQINQILEDFNILRLAHGEGPPRPLRTGESIQELQRRLQEDLARFTDGPPFTSQRLCELLLYPIQTYRKLDKVALAFEKLLLVTSSLDPSPEPYPHLPLPAEKLLALALPAMPSLHKPEENGTSEAMDVEGYEGEHRPLGLSLFAGSLPGNRHPDAPLPVRPRSPSPPLAPHSPPRGSKASREATPPPPLPVAAADVGPQPKSVEAALAEVVLPAGPEGAVQESPSLAAEANLPPLPVSDAALQNMSTIK